MNFCMHLIKGFLEPSEYFRYATHIGVGKNVHFVRLKLSLPLEVFIYSDRLVKGKSLSLTKTNSH